MVYNRVIDLVNELTENGIVSKLVSTGLMSPKVILYKNIYLDHDRHIQIKVRKFDAIELTAETFGVSIQTVYTALNFMNEKVEK